MDAPNAPNPANPNVQDQNVDAVQGPMNLAEGPAVQNPAQGPTNQNQTQVPAVQIPVQVPAGPIPAQGPAQVVQNIPVQPLQELVPIQLAPAGIVVPTP